MDLQNKLLNNPSSPEFTRNMSSKYEGMYGSLIELTADAMKQKYKYEWSSNDTIAFGKYADTWNDYRSVFEEDITSRNSLGDALSSNLGLVAMAYSAIPIQMLASVQPLSDQSGTIFLRKSIAVNSRGTVKAGDTLIGPLGNINNDVHSFMSETQVVNVKITNNTTLTYQGNLEKETTPNTVKVSVSGGKIKGMDDGEGHIIGVNIDASQSTIDYRTGAYKIVFTNLTTPGVENNDMMDIVYQHNSIASNDIPTMKWVLDSKTVIADYDVLQSQYSNISELVLRKKFGSELSQDVSADLVSQVAAGIMTKAIRKLHNSAVIAEAKSGVSITWSEAAPEGVSENDYRRTFDDKFIEAVDVMYKVAGKGDVSAIITGSKGKKILRTNGMTIMNNSVSGPHLCGYYDNVPVFYAPNVIADGEMIVVYRGSNWYESPLVYAPWLPVTTVSGHATTNVLTNAQAVYHASALEEVVNGFAVRINIQ